MGSVEGPFCDILALASQAIWQRHNSVVYAEIDDHGVSRDNTGRILAQWRCPVASRVALDLPHWAMPSAPYRLIRMAIEMTSEAAAFVLLLIICRA